VKSRPKIGLFISVKASPPPGGAGPPASLTHVYGFCLKDVRAKRNGKFTLYKTDYSEFIRPRKAKE
jgi:hypothetical protein